MVTHFSIDSARADRTVRVTLRGEIDMTTAPVVEKAATVTVLDVETDLVVLDMTEVSFIDSTGLGALVTVRLLAKDNATTLVLRGLRPGIRRVFAIAGLEDLFHFEPALG